MGRCHPHPDSGRGVSSRAAPVHPCGQQGPCQAPPPARRAPPPKCGSLRGEEGRASRCVQAEGRSGSAASADTWEAPAPEGKPPVR